MHHFSIDLRQNYLLLGPLFVEDLVKMVYFVEDGSGLLERWKSSRAKIVMERIVQHGFDCDDKGKLCSAREVYQLDKEFSSFP